MLGSKYLNFDCSTPSIESIDFFIFLFQNNRTKAEVFLTVYKVTKVIQLFISFRNFYSDNIFSIVSKNTKIFNDQDGGKKSLRCFKSDTNESANSVIIQLQVSSFII